MLAREEGGDQRLGSSLVLTRGVAGGCDLWCSCEGEESRLGCSREGARSAALEGSHKERIDDARKKLTGSVRAWLGEERIGGGDLWCSCEGARARSPAAAMLARKEGGDQRLGSSLVLARGVVGGCDLWCSCEGEESRLGCSREGARSAALEGSHKERIGDAR
ncbi:hypothetical protein ZIOFF_042477 [Zingiber officinale]|uniref:Uncharacterized protein n=1 Tax=Zingiber officinale TaxID=94328 RepID=A0A8J5FVQ8_ZINOF|nr:hypothetical protein ZIOFF_042477 [Zingiber officinale]